ARVQRAQEIPVSQRMERVIPLNVLQLVHPGRIAGDKVWAQSWLIVASAVPGRIKAENTAGFVPGQGSQCAGKLGAGEMLFQVRERQSELVEIECKVGREEQQGRDAKGHAGTAGEEIGRADDQREAEEAEHLNLARADALPDESAGKEQQHRNAD